MAWKLLYQSIVGTSHEKNGGLCQDYCLATRIQTEDGELLVAACADGAGSAPLGQLGAEVSCNKFIQMVSEALQNGLRLPDVNRSTFVTWFGAIHDALVNKATEREMSVRDLACTFLAAIIGPRDAAFAQLGDGGIVIGRENVYDVVFWPDHGEYLNTTFFLTDPAFESHLMFTTRGFVDDIAMLSDGLQMLALNFVARQPHVPFFVPFFKALREAPREDELVAPLRSFLGSGVVNERTDDDKTLILATRVQNGAT